MSRFGLAVVVLIAVCAALLWTLVRRELRAAVVLSALSGLWLAANNRVMEGAVLITVDRHHGLTVSDLLAYGGAVVAVLTALSAPGGHSLARRRSTAVLCAGLFLAGLTLSYFYQPGRG